MLKDYERMAEKMKNKQKDKEYLDIIYSIESFLIDLKYQNESIDAAKQSRIGKIALSQQAIEENELSKVCSKLRPVLNEMSIGPEIKGARMIEVCTLHALRIKQKSKAFYIRDVYAVVAEKFHTTPANCERLCRYACSKIEFSKDFGKKFPFLEGMTHRTYEKVTVKELVENLSEYLANKHKFKSKMV